MFGLIEKLFIGLLSLCTVGRFCELLTFNSKESIICLSLDNQPCHARPTFININSAMKFFFINLLLVSISCNTVNDPCA